MARLLAFDVYGTLIDTQGIETALNRLIGERSAAFSDLWRQKQLEYSFRRGLMNRYRGFNICTAQALDFCCAALGVPLGSAEKSALMNEYGRLPPFRDVRPALQRLNEQGNYMVAFSNGTLDAVRGLLKQAQLDDFFSDVVSVDEIGTFKPSPAVYQHLLKRCDVAANDAWLVSSNSFDVIGARAEQLQAAWVQRSSKAIFDPWEYQPSLTVTDLEELAEQLPA